MKSIFSRSIIFEIKFVFLSKLLIQFHKKKERKKQNKEVQDDSNQIDFEKYIKKITF